jgi:acyl dehydratase
MGEPGERRYLDDFHVGQRFTTGTYTMTEAKIVAFASEFDPQPFHLSEDEGRDSLLGGLAASGWHTAAVTMRLQVEGEMQMAGGMVGAGGEITWPAPTRPGDVLRVETEVLDVRPSRSRLDRGIVTVVSETKNQDGVVVQALKATLVVLRR